MDYIPRDDAEWDEWLENFAAQLPAIATAVGGIPLKVWRGGIPLKRVT